MKKKFYCLIACIFALGAKSQSYMGFFQDNYSGVHGLLYNPATIVDSRFKTDINLFSANLMVSNDYYATKVADLFKKDYSIENQGIKYLSSNNNGFGSVDILGPSFMFNIAPKHSIAFFTRARSIFNISNVDGRLFEQINDNFNLKTDLTTNAQNFNGVAHSWAEFGISYAAVIFDKQTHFLKGGFSIKYLQGIQNTYANADNVNVNYKYNSANQALNPITSSGLITYGESQDLSLDTSERFNKGSKGLGLDFGFVYEYRPNYDDFITTDKNGKTVYLKNKNKYKYKVGLSVTDIGAIDYQNATKQVYNVGGIISAETFNKEKPQDVLEKLYTLVQTQKSNKAYLPTAFHANVDWNVSGKLYLNLNADVNMNSKTAINTNTMPNTFALTPRYESKWFSFSLPLTQSDLRGFMVGSSLRFGPIFVGSGSVLTNLISDKSKGVDAYFGTKIPIYQGKMKDRDGDGIYDKYDKCPGTAGPEDNGGCPYEDNDGDGTVNKKDACPDMAGPKENKGCPWPDTDNDGTIDNEDKCPNMAGPKENQGCLWPDTDQDETIDKEDRCPNVAGPKENEGCPWEDTDKDGIADKDDKCPNQSGTVANNGCPDPVATALVEPSKEIIKKINDYSKTILFDTGKASIKPSSFGNLDAIVVVLNEYKDAKFKIEGHTDNAGKAVKNLNLSKERAAAVKNYFIQKGIDSARLSSEGYGSKKPIASNKTMKGRNQNRRVVINLIK